MAEASYPADVNTWTAALSYYGARTAQATLTVYAYCLKASFPIGVHIVQSPRPDFFPGDGSPLTSTVVCPQGAALTGGGFQTHYGNGGAVTSQPANYVFASKPDSNGWSVTTESQSSNYGQIVFAVCATQNLTASDPTMHNFVASPTSSVEDSATCPSSFQLLTGGGFEAGFNGSHGGFGTDLFYADHATSDLSKWDIQLYNADTGQHGIERSWAVCVGLPQHT